MKKLFWIVTFLASTIVVPVPTMAEMNISIGVSLPLPPVIEFRAAPDVIVVPEADSVYVVPDIEVELFFSDGWWWRPWEGRWYRSRYYDRGWTHYSKVPAFYFDVDPGWRKHYRDHNWYGHRWNYERISHRRLQRDWKKWRDNRYWERQGNWGVRDYRHYPRHKRQELRRQREEQYQRRAEVRHEGRHEVRQPQMWEREERGGRPQLIPMERNERRQIHSREERTPKNRSVQRREEKSREYRRATNQENQGWPGSRW